MFAQRKLQLTKIEVWILPCFFTKNGQKNARKFRENLNKVLIVGDDVGWHFQSPGTTSRYGNLTKNTQKKWEKTSEKNTNGLENVMYWFQYSFKVLCIYPKMEISPGLTKIT